MNRSRRLSGPLALAAAGAVLFAFSLVYFLYSYLVRFGTPADSRASALRAIAIDILLFTVFATHHSLLARARLKQRIQLMLPHGLERSTYTWVASLLFVMVCAWWQPVPGEVYRFSGEAAWPGFAVQGLGILLAARSSARLDVLDLAGVRPVLGAWREETGARVQLETSGPYGFVRHPLYSGWVLFVFATPHMTLTRLVFATVSTVYLAVAIPLEERSLIREFGADYRSYQNKVRWRMIPGVY